MMKKTGGSSNKIAVQCQECGKRFKTASPEPHCPKCHGYDIDLDGKGWHYA